MSNKEMVARIAELEAKLAAKKAGQAHVSFKVSAKGAVSVYGLGRFPVTLYAGQWARLIEHLEGLKAFIADNQSKLAVKE